MTADKAALRELLAALRACLSDGQYELRTAGVRAAYDRWSRGEPAEKDWRHATKRLHAALVAAQACAEVEG